jgi:hypothetical protein
MEFDGDFNIALKSTVDLARARSHEFATIEHLLLGLLDAPSVIGLVLETDQRLPQLRSKLQVFLDEQEGLIAERIDVPKPTRSFEAVVEHATALARTEGYPDVTALHVLETIFEERHSHAVQFLRSEGLSRSDVSRHRYRYGSLTDGNDSVAKDFFISYAKEDIDQAAFMVETLKAEGYTTFVQFEDFLPGKNFVREMQRGLAGTRRMIALYSPNYEKSEHCQAEWSAAYNDDPGSVKTRIIPFLITPTELSPLARQIVYTSLVGLDDESKKTAILRAIYRVSRPRDKSEFRKVAASFASPSTEVRDNKLDAVGNREFDTPLHDPKVIDIAIMLNGVIATILPALPGNCPPVVHACFTRYAASLAEGDQRPVIGLLTILHASLEKEYHSADFDLWGPGLSHLFEEFIAKHILYLGYFPGNAERDRFVQETSIDHLRASGSRLQDPVRAATAVLQKISEAGLTTDRFDQTVSDQELNAAELASIGLSEPHVSALTSSVKKRFIVNTIGFYEKLLSALANMSKIIDSSLGHQAATIIRESIDRLLQLIK